MDAVLFRFSCMLKQKTVATFMILGRTSTVQVVAAFAQSKQV